MDKFESSVLVIKALYGVRNGSLTEGEFISVVCDFFDKFKDEEIAENDKQLLLYLANYSGIPHYYDMLVPYLGENNSFPANINLNVVSSIAYDSSLIVNEKTKIHRFQKRVYDLFKPQEAPIRFFLSASTSFGKTFLVFEVIRKMEYENVLLIFPTIALLAENLEKIKENPDYSYFQDIYTIHTLSDEREEFEGRNIFLFTPERYLSFMDKNRDRISFDFCFVDEVYKIDNDYIIDEEVRENDRDVAYRIAIYELFTSNPNSDSLLVGPYISIPERSDVLPSFHRFLDKFGIVPIDMNEIEVVNKTRLVVPRTRTQKTIDSIDFDFSSGSSKGKQLNQILLTLSNIDENAIIYCFSKSSVESYTKKFIEAKESEHNYDGYSDFISHVESKFHPDWVVVKALKQGIGVHHGVVPKYIQKEIINLFNSGQLHYLFSTTTITEGVNTTAKNIVITHYKKGNKLLKQFDAKNIEGRAGRFLSHYKGRVITLEREFERIVEEAGEIIKHKNFDEESPKDDVDLDITSDEYLSDQAKQRKVELQQLLDERQIPAHIIDQFKSISKADKISVYDAVLALSEDDHLKILELIKKVNYAKPQIDYDGFQVVIDTFSNIVRDNNLNFLLEKAERENGALSDHSRIAYKLYFYLRDGFMGAVQFQLESGNDIDTAIRKSSEFIYNTLKYQLVKYLGVFNTMYKYERSLRLGDEVEEIRGIDRLLTKLEYNAFNYSARIASDYGAPYNVIRHFDAEEGNIVLDSYEQKIRDRVMRLLTNQGEG